MPVSSAHPGSPAIYVIDFHQAPRFYEPWIYECGAPVEWIRNFRADWEPPADALLLVSAETYMEPSVSVLRRGVEKDIPVLILPDGILEYRNTWHNATQVSGGVLQVVLGHKLACLGASQCRHVESWGNPGTGEVVGFPAFDNLDERRARRDVDEFRLLIATARTPYFDAAQKEVVLAQLTDLRRELEAWQRRTHKPTRILWRLTAGLSKELGVEPADGIADQGPLRDLLHTCDAVVTTPSTLMLEAMRLDLPVAVLDYFNVPAYVPAAWRMTAPQHIPATLDELLRPAEARMQFQRVTLHDALECATPAAPRMIELATRMIAIGKDCRAQGRPLAFPTRILPAPDAPPRASVVPPWPPSSDESPGAPGPVVGSEASPAVLLELRHLRRALSHRQGLLEQRRAQLDAFEQHLNAVSVRLRAIQTGVVAARRDVARFVAAHVAATRRLLVWGTGSYAAEVFDHAPDLLQAIAAFVDSAPARQGVRFLDRPVLSPDSLAASADFVLVASSYGDEIAASLEAKGFRAIEGYLVLDNLLPRPGP
jgi:hypothetical protein